ncbi:hypothetical protein DSO57_1004248 [Entomophthora muscae]|uniref:Uncharacterized protein n=1 Tax=Entomophthora muscae TaxID=34485 RepID=A0ACC2SAR0_9FUNG|nr:hypothetical protein DSO57_1004248 [Entomophthora muscae]
MAAHKLPGIKVLKVVHNDIAHLFYLSEETDWATFEAQISKDFKIECPLMVSYENLLGNRKIVCEEEFKEVFKYINPDSHLKIVTCFDVEEFSENDSDEYVSKDFILKSDPSSGEELTSHEGASVVPEKSSLFETCLPINTPSDSSKSAANEHRSNRITIVKTNKAKADSELELRNLLLLLFIFIATFLLVLFSAQFVQKKVFRVVQGLEYRSYTLLGFKLRFYQAFSFKLRCLNIYGLSICI